MGGGIARGNRGLRRGLAGRYHDGMIRQLKEQAMAENPVRLVLDEPITPEELAAFRARQARYDRNWDWLEAHAAEAYSHRGKVLCVAGQQLFVADTVEEAVAQAKAAHPDDDGRLIRYVPKDRLERIYAHRRSVAPV
jgi:hypothetical protein